MRPYPQKLLSNGEEEVFQLRPHFRALLVPGLVLLGALVLLAFGAVIWRDNFMSKPLWIFALIVLTFGTVVPFLRWMTTQYVFTNRRIITRSGLVARQGRDIPLSKVNNVTFKVTFMGRILNYGTLRVESGANDTRGEDDLVIKDIPSVEMVQRRIYDLYEENDKRRRGVDDDDDRRRPHLADDD